MTLTTPIHREAFGSHQTTVCLDWKQIDCQKWRPYKTVFSAHSCKEEWNGLPGSNQGLFKAKLCYSLAVFPAHSWKGGVKLYARLQPRAIKAKLWHGHAPFLLTQNLYISSSQGHCRKWDHKIKVSWINIYYCRVIVKISSYNKYVIL